MVDTEVRVVLAAKFEGVFPQLDERQRRFLTILNRDPHEVIAGDRRRSLSMS